MEKLNNTIKEIRRDKKVRNNKFLLMLWALNSFLQCSCLAANQFCLVLAYSVLVGYPALRSWFCRELAFQFQWASITTLFLVSAILGAWHSQQIQFCFKAKWFLFCCLGMLSKVMEIISIFHLSILKAQSPRVSGT